MHMRLKGLLAASGVAVLGLFGVAGPSAAADYPSQPITVVVPFPPGGTSDLLARTMGKAMSERLGVSVVIENKGGGGTLIGSQYVARSKPDGYTVLLAATPHAINASLYKNIPYSAVKDFRTVAYLAELPLVVAVAKDSKIKSLKDLNQEILEGKEETTYGSSGLGGTAHLATELYLKAIGGHSTHVPYRGSNPAVMDLAAGRTTFVFDTLYLISSQVDAGRLRPLAQTGKTRHDLMADVPTMMEEGVPDYEVTSWFSLAVPSGTPEEAIAALNKAANDALNDPEVKEFLVAQGLSITGGSAEEGQARLLREIDTWAKAVEVSGASVE